jgi:hypothetical protein
MLSDAANPVLQLARGARAARESDEQTRLWMIEIEMPSERWPRVVDRGRFERGWMDYVVASRCSSNPQSRVIAAMAGK